MAADTKTALLDSAERVVRARGFDGFSYADLAETVGIRKASIHHHFPTKADLSSALVQRYQAVLSARCAEIDRQAETGAERLRALIGLYRDALNGGASLCLCVSLISSRESLSDDVIEEIKTYRAMMVGWIRSVFILGQSDKSISDVVNAAAEAHAALSLLEGAHLAARARENTEAFDEAVELLMVRC